MQEERQRSRERAESEAECANSGHEDMPVERILEAELAVEPKTESYGDMNTENSVGGLRSPSNCRILDGARHGQGTCVSLRICPFRLLCSFFRLMTLSPIYVMLLISSFLLSLNGPSVFPISLTSPWRTRSFCSGQVSILRILFSWDKHVGCHFALGILKQVTWWSWTHSSWCLLLRQDYPMWDCFFLYYLQSLKFRWPIPKQNNLLMDD